MGDIGRLRLGPLDTNNIDLGINNKKAIPRVTRAKSSLIRTAEKVFIDENHCRLEVHLKKEIIIDGDNVIISRTFFEDNSELQRINIRKRCISSNSASTESIPECKSISNIESPTDNNLIHIDLIDRNKTAALQIDMPDRETILPKDSLISEHLYITTNNFYFTPSFRKIKIDRISVNVPKSTIAKPNILRRTRNNVSLDTVPQYISENLSDEYYLSQHSKYEADEKKMEREHRNSFMTCKHYSRSYNSHNFSSPSVQSKKWKNSVPGTFDSNNLTDDIIVVKDEVNVTAFGAFLPILKPRAFHLDKRTN